MNVSHVTGVFGEVHCTNCFFLNNCKDLKSTMLAGRSFQIFTTLMLKKDSYWKRIFLNNDIDYRTME